MTKEFFENGKKIAKWADNNMKQHKWHKEIKAWADGAEIEVKNSMDINEWIPCAHPNWSEGFTEEVDWIEYRIKPQPVEPKYLLVYNINGEIKLCEPNGIIEIPRGKQSIRKLGQIKLESNDD